MPTERYCRVCRGWHDPIAWPPKCAPEEKRRSALPAPQIISDIMEPVQSQLDGRTYDSKSKLRGTYRDAGVVEIGNDSSVAAPKRKRTVIDRQSVKASVAKAFSQTGFGA